jgi:uncharacterized membrane protein YfcA
MSLEATFFSSYSQFILACLVVFVAQTIYVLFGFGLGLIGVGLLAMFIQPVTNVVVLLLFIAIPAEIYVLCKSWKNISWRGIIAIICGVAGGTVVGTMVLKYGDPHFILTILAFFLIVSGIIFLLMDSDIVIHLPSWCTPLIGILSGLLSGMFGTGGPPLIFYYQLSGMKKHIFRGQLMTLFFLMALVRFTTYSFSGLITTTRFISAIYIIPAILLGIWLGNSIHIQISEKGFRKMVSIALIIIGIILLTKQWVGAHP